MKTIKTKRNWSEYNQKIVRQASITLYLSEEIMQNGGKYTGKRLSGGVKEYSDALIETCLLIKIYMKLGYRQTPERKKEKQRVFVQRDEAISYFEANKINGSKQMARANWKK